MAIPKSSKLITLFLVILFLIWITNTNHNYSSIIDGSDASDNKGNEIPFEVDINNRLLSNIQLSELKIENETGFNWDGSDFITFDNNDNIIVTGGIINPQTGGIMGYVSQLSRNGTINWTVKIGGINHTSAYGVAVDSENNIIVGFDSDNTQLPVIHDNQEYSSTYNGGGDVYLVKLDEAGNILWSSYFGGSLYDDIGPIIVDSEDNFYFSGNTASSDLEIKNAFQENHSTDNGSDFYIVKFNKNLTLGMSTYFGGTDNEDISLLTLDNEGNIILGGSTYSSDIPVINSNSSYSGLQDFFIAKFDNQNYDLIWSTYFGGTGRDFIAEVATDSNNNVYISGETNTINYPTTEGAFDEEDDDGSVGDIALTKFDENGQLIWSTIVGGSQGDAGKGMAIDSQDDIILTGVTYSSDFPISNDAFDSTGDPAGGTPDGFLTKFNSMGELVFSTYFGGVKAEDIRDVAIDSQNNIAFSGITQNSSYPVINSPHQYSYGGFLDTLLTKFSSDGMPIWSHHTAVITEPRSDLDGDGLTNQVEYTNHINPLEFDTDGDGMDDGWEIAHNLNPRIDDTGDYDNDGLTNIQEYHYGTDPNSGDTDGDGMEDTWEINNSLDPLTDDRWENRDGDLFPNIVEYRFRMIGFRANNITDSIVTLVFIFSIIAFTIRFFVRRRKLSYEAKELGFDNVDQMNLIKSRGYSNYSQYLESKNLGFYTSKVKQVFNERGISNSSEIEQYWNEQIEKADSEWNKEIYDEYLSNLDKISSIIEFYEYQETLMEIITNVANTRLKLEQIENDISIIQSESKKYEISPIDHLEPSSLEKFKNKVMVKLEEINSFNDKLTSLNLSKKEWFEPWNAILTFIKLTEPEEPIPLSKIAAVVNFDEEHVEEILIHILEEYSWIGKYDSSEKTYYKASKIMGYLNDALQQLDNYKSEIT